MSRILLTGNGAAAWAARLARVDYIPAFPITPQTEIIETLAGWCESGEMEAKLVMLESEHSMVTAAGAAATTGVRVYSATSSQGLLYAMEMLYAVSGWRAPFVLTNVSRGLASPITLESDHNDVMATRDAGILQLHCASCQEVLDNTLLAYRLAEDPRVRLPVLVNMDGFYLSFTREPVELPESAQAAEFVGRYAAENLRFRASAPLSQAVAVLGGGPYSYFRYETHLAMQNGLDVFDEVAAEFAQRFGRHYRVVEGYRDEDAEFLFVMMGSFASKAQNAVDQLREAGWKVGLVRPRLWRPLPIEALRLRLLGKQAIAIVDQNLSMGMGGVLHSEITSVLYGQAGAPMALSYIGGLGGRDIGPEEFYQMAREMKQANASRTTPPPRLLYTEDELREVRMLQAVARVERDELANSDEKNGKDIDTGGAHE